MASGHVNRTNRPNTWQLRPTPQSEDSSCQPGAVHTWPIATMLLKPHVRFALTAAGGLLNSLVVNSEFATAAFMRDPTRANSRAVAMRQFNLSHLSYGVERLPQRDTQLRFRYVFTSASARALYT